MSLPIEQMLNDVAIAEKCDGLLMGEPVVQDLCCHVRALAAELQYFRDYLQACREFDAEVDFCDECEPRAECPEHAVQVMSLAKTARQLLPDKPMFEGPKVSGEAYPDGYPSPKDVNYDYD